MERFYQELNSARSEDILGTNSWKSLCVSCLITYRDNEVMIQEMLDQYSEFCLDNDSHRRRFDHLQWLMSLLPSNTRQNVNVINPSVDLDTLQDIIDKDKIATTPGKYSFTIKKGDS